MSATLSPADIDLLFPPRLTDYWRAQFRLVRYVRQNLKLLHTHEELSIRAVIAEWIPHAAQRFQEHTRNIDEDDIWCVIREKWDLAHWPLGFNPLAEAVRRAETNPNVPPPPPRYGECHSLVWRVVWNVNLLCLKAGETDFFVGSHDLARRINYAQQVVLRALHRLERDKLLTVCERGTGVPKTGKATAYHVF